MLVSATYLLWSLLQLVEYAKQVVSDKWERKCSDMSKRKAYQKKDKVNLSKIFSYVNNIQNERNFPTGISHSVVQNGNSLEKGKIKVSAVVDNSETQNDHSSKIKRKRNKKRKKRLNSSKLEDNVCFSEAHENTGYCIRNEQISDLYSNSQRCDSQNPATEDGLSSITNDMQARSLTYSEALKKSITSDKVPDKQDAVMSEGQYVKQFLKSVRYENYAPYGKWVKKGWLSKSGEAGIFSILSYNVLSQRLLEMHRYNLYSEHTEEYLTWAYRSKLFLEEIKTFKADILCLQEVDAEYLDFYLKELGSLGYEGIYKKRTNDKVDGCAIFFQKSYFDLKEHASIEYYQPGNAFLDRDNIGIIARFSPRDNPDKDVVVANTHLLFNPRRHDIKLCQVQMLLAEIERIAFKHNDRQEKPLYHPVILMGDFNIRPYTPVYDLIENGWLDYQNNPHYNLRVVPKHLGITDNCQHSNVVKHRQKIRSDMGDHKFVKVFHSEKVKMEEQNLYHSNENFHTGRLKHHLNLLSVYPQQPEYDSVTTFQDEWCTVDYIFYGPAKEVEDGLRRDGELKLISYLTLPSVVEAAEIIQRIPNSACSSDHFPLLAKFHLPPDLEKLGAR